LDYLFLLFCCFVVLLLCCGVNLWKRREIIVSKFVIELFDWMNMLKKVLNMLRVKEKLRDSLENMKLKFWIFDNEIYFVLFIWSETLVSICLFHLFQFHIELLYNFFLKKSLLIRIFFEKFFLFVYFLKL